MYRLKELLLRRYLSVYGMNVLVCLHACMNVSMHDCVYFSIYIYIHISHSVYQTYEPFD
jgi:hypothetical protein